MPSIINNGSDEPLMEVIPRNLIEIPPPGAPELEVIFAPLNLPYKAPSVVVGGTTPVNSADDMDATELAAFPRFTFVARPVTTTCSKTEVSSFIIIFKEEAPGKTSISWGA